MLGPVASIARVDDDKRCHLATPTTSAYTNGIPEPTSRATEPLRLRERRGWQRTLTP